MEVVPAAVSKDSSVGLPDEQDSVLDLPLSNTLFPIKKGWIGSRKEFVDEFSVDIGQTVVSTLGSVRESFVIEAQAMEQRGLDVVYMHRLVDDVVSEFIGSSVGDSRFDTATCEPHAVGFRVVVASTRASEGCVAFDHGSASEFATPDH